MRSFIGIDLGTTFSAVAKIDEHGKPVIVYDNEGKNLTPSCIARDPNSEKIEVGEFARREAYSGISKNAAARFKRDMGTSGIYTLAGEEYTPTDLSALVLKELLRSRDIQPDDIEEVVVTVPANFASSAREATMEAAKRAGLNVNYIINEPTAAALCYSFREGMNLEGAYAIYDLGGGTFDISIIRIEGKDVEVLASNGIHKLGGTDFDEAIQKLINQKYQAVAGEAIDLGDFTPEHAEVQKKDLSKRTKVGFRIKSEALEVTRQEFEELISAQITQAEMLCESTLDEAGLQPKDVRGVLCAGGSTRIPMVQESIKRVFAQDPIFRANVDEVVALGAALYAAYKGDHEKLSPAQRDAISDMRFTERTGQCFGTFALSGGTDGIREINSILINKGTIIPCEAKHSYYTVADGQTAVNCELTESVNEEIDPQFVQVVRSCKLPLPSGRPSGQEIQVIYQYDVNQIVHCTYEDVETGEKVEIHYNAKPNADSDSDISEFTVE